MDIEPPVQDGNSSITTTVSISEGDISANVVHGVYQGNEEVNQLVIPQNNFQVLGAGPINIMAAYPLDNEAPIENLPPLLQQQGVEQGNAVELLAAAPLVAPADNALPLVALADNALPMVAPAENAAVEMDPADEMQAVHIEVSLHETETLPVRVDDEQITTSEVLSVVCPVGPHITKKGKEDILVVQNPVAATVSEPEKDATVSDKSATAILHDKDSSIEKTKGEYTHASWKDLLENHFAKSSHGASLLALKNL